jgi:hypothetical protein
MVTHGEMLTVPYLGWGRSGTAARKPDKEEAGGS